MQAPPGALDVRNDQPGITCVIAFIAKRAVTTALLIVSVVSIAAGSVILIRAF